MGKIIVTEFISVDGVMEAPGPDGSDYKYAGWTFAFKGGEASDKFKLDETMEAQAALLGRKTYEGFAKAWPNVQGEFADKFNTMPKYVVSSTLTDASWKNTTILQGNLVDQVTKLKQDIAGPIMVAGSAQLVQALIEHDLVDELRLMVFPVILGAGTKLFGDTSDKKTLQLSDTRTFDDGVILLIYRPRPNA